MYLLALLIVVAIAISFYRYNSLRYDYYKLRLMFDEIRSDILKYSAIAESLAADVKELNNKADIIYTTTEMVFHQHTYSNKTMRLVLLNTRQIYSIINNGYKSKYIKHNVASTKRSKAQAVGKYAKNEPLEPRLESLADLASDKELEGKGTTVKLADGNAAVEQETGQGLKDSTDNIGDWL